MPATTPPTSVPKGHLKAFSIYRTKRGAYAVYSPTCVPPFGLYDADGKLLADVGSLTPQRAKKLGIPDRVLSEAWKRVGQQRQFQAEMKSNPLFAQGA